MTSRNKSVCACVCVWERERDSGVIIDSLCLCVCDRDSEVMSASVCLIVWESERELDWALRERGCVWERKWYEKIFIFSDILKKVKQLRKVKNQKQLLFSSAEHFLIIATLTLYLHYFDPQMAQPGFLSTLRSLVMSSLVSDSFDLPIVREKRGGKTIRFELSSTLDPRLLT